LAAKNIKILFVQKIFADDELLESGKKIFFSMP